ncbi:hypothetical protein [Jiangella endophytica]|uniref:hypothetical protein n=1 Tax=Jiangella endophytica TaxID=1623398 RepID=UPI000E3510CA|nr:hypothetical protein [Jiangella endophytica]
MHGRPRLIELVQDEGPAIFAFLLAAGCGPLNDVPRNAHSPGLTRKRLRQQAAALARLLPALLPGEAVGGSG